MRPLLKPEAVIEARLCQSIQRAMGLNELRTGRHVFRDAQSHRRGVTIARRLWAVEIQPAATAPGCLAAVVTEQGTMIVLAVPEDLGSLGAVIPARLNLASNWTDPVAGAISKIDLWPAGDGIPFGGCSYGLFAHTAQIHAAMSFCHTWSPSLIALKGALLEVAKMFRTAEANSSVASFIDRWEVAITASPTTG